MLRGLLGLNRSEVRDQLLDRCFNYWSATFSYLKHCLLFCHIYSTHLLVDQYRKYRGLHYKLFTFFIAKFLIYPLRIRNIIWSNKAFLLQHWGHIYDFKYRKCFLNKSNNLFELINFGWINNNPLIVMCATSLS